MYDPNPLDGDTLIRLSPKKAPFRRANIGFATLAPVIMSIGEFAIEQLLRLVEEPLVDVDESRDGGDTWRRHDLSPLPAFGRATTDPALSPQRAIDPTGVIVPREVIKTPDGSAAPPEAADPAVPLAGTTPLAPAANAAGAADRPVATGEALLGEDGSVAESVATDPTAAPATPTKPRTAR